MTTKTLEFNNIERKIFWILATALGVVVIFYLYSVLTLTVAVVDRNSMNASAHELASRASELETEYLSQTNSITLAYAETLGFSEVNAKFAHRGTEVASLAMAR